jgi:hypothetical protein
MFAEGFQSSTVLAAGLSAARPAGVCRGVAGSRAPLGLKKLSRRRTGLLLLPLPLLLNSSPKDEASREARKIRDVHLQTFWPRVDDAHAQKGSESRHPPRPCLCQTVIFETILKKMKTKNTQ